jgi:hypothetical protein
LFPFLNALGNSPGRDLSLVAAVASIMDRMKAHIQGDLRKLDLLIAVATAGEGFLAEGGGALWKLGANKSTTKWAAQMEKRGWTAGQITEAI